jgi:hypothetical protein
LENNSSAGSASFFFNDKWVFMLTDVSFRLPQGQASELLGMFGLENADATTPYFICHERLAYYGFAAPTGYPVVSGT